MNKSQRSNIISAIGYGQMITGIAILLVTAYYDRTNFVDSFFFTGIFKSVNYDHAIFNSFGEYAKAIIPLALAIITFKAADIIRPGVKQDKSQKKYLRPAYSNAIKEFEVFTKEGELAPLSLLVANKTEVEKQDTKLNH